MQALPVRKETVQSGGNLGESQKFSIKISGRLFSTLITGLYSAKIPSVVREILANAFDAHIASGNTKDAVQVFLPTLFNSTFRVRDFGSGMSHEFVMRLYTQLGHSEKADANDQTGMFGLGAKSPFCMADQFTVTTYSGRVKRTYIASIADDGIPQLQNPIEMASVEPRGVEINVPVQRSQVAEFETAVRDNAFNYFDRHIVFNRDIGSGVAGELAKDRIAKVVDGVYVMPGKHYGCRIYIRQGFALYPLNTDSLKLSTVDVNKLHSFWRVFTDNKLMIDAPIGTFNVTASRESIQYDPASTVNITNLVLDAQARFMGLLREIVGGAATFKRAREILSPYLVSPTAPEGSLAHVHLVSRYIEVLKTHIQENWRESSLYNTDDKNMPEVETRFWPSTFGHTVRLATVGSHRMEKLEVANVDLQTHVFVLSSKRRVGCAGLKDASNALFTARYKRAATSQDYKPNIVVAYCDPTNIPTVCATFLSREHILTSVYTEADLVPLPAKARLPRAPKLATTKVTLTKLNEILNSATPFSARMPADYAVPAYYLTRNIKMAGVNWASVVKEGPVACANVRVCALTSMLSTARGLGLLLDMPIYVLPEKMVRNIGKRAPLWREVTQDINQGLLKAVANIPVVPTLPDPVLRPAAFASGLAREMLLRTGSNKRWLSNDSLLAVRKMLMTCDGFAAYMLPYFLTDDGYSSCAAWRAAASRQQAFQRFYKLVFNVPVELPKEQVDVQALQTSAESEFRLLTHIAEAGEDLGEHLLMYLTSACARSKIKIPKASALDRALIELRVTLSIGVQIT